jgi:hypothetical protein
MIVGHLSEIQVDVGEVTGVGSVTTGEEAEVGVMSEGAIV